MAKNSAGRLEGEGASSGYPLRQRRGHQHQMKSREENSEEEEETIEVEDKDDVESEEDVEGAGNSGKRKIKECCLNGSVSWTVSDPDVLDCSVCFELLTVPVFQCENGHVACSTCGAGATLKNKCPSCGWPIGYRRCRAIEKVLESVKVVTQKRNDCGKQEG